MRKLPQIRLSLPLHDKGDFIASIIPWYYGRAHYDYEVNLIVLYIIPLNLVVRFLIAVWYRARVGIKPLWVEELGHRAYRRGFGDGWNKGFEAGVSSKEVRV